MKKLLLPLTGIALVAALAGCTSTGDGKPTTSPSASASASADADAAATDADAPPTGQCVDGQALITGKETADGKASLPDGCATVFVLVDNTAIDLGPTTKLVFEGTGNTATYTGDAPEVVGGENNTVTAAD